MTPKEFKKKAQAIYDEYDGRAGEAGHMDMDSLMYDCLRSLGYQEGLAILDKMRNVWYA